MSKKLIDLPPGFRFNPRDDELINDYLKPRIMGQKLPCNIINDDVKVYAPDSTPWLLFDLNNPDSWIDSITNAEKTLYVFTSLSKIVTDSNKTITRTRCNTSKRAGCGAWVQRTTRLPIIDRNDNVIGRKRMLNFVIHDIDAQFDLDKAVYFKMHEYSLWGINDNLGSDLVLCEITFDPCKKSFCKLATKTTDQVSRRGRKPQNEKLNNKNLQGSSTWMSERVPVMSSNVYQECTSSHPESSVAIDASVGNDDLYATAPSDIGVQHFDVFGGGLCFDGRGGEGLCFDGLGGEGLSFDDLGGEEDLLESFDIAGFMEYMKSNPEVEPFEDKTIHALGKRKFTEEDDSCQAKKICF